MNRNAHQPTEEDAAKAQGAHELCPNCGSAVEDHKEDGCMLAALITVLRDRGTHDAAAIRRIHANCDVDRLWQSINEVVDRLGDGAFESKPAAPGRAT